MRTYYLDGVNVHYLGSPLIIKGDNRRIVGYLVNTNWYDSERELALGDDEIIYRYLCRIIYKLQNIER